MISENFEITCLKWLKHHTCAPVKLSVINENLILSHLSFLCLLTSLLNPKNPQETDKSKSNFHYLAEINNC